MNLRRAVHGKPVIRALLWPGLAVRRRLLARRAARDSRLWMRYAEMLAADPIIRVPGFCGIFEVGARSHIARRLIVEGAYEDRIPGVWLSFADADRDVIDVGANLGFYTVLAALHLGRGKVWAIEPSPEARRLLERNLILNRVQSRAVIVEALAGASSGEATLFSVPGLPEYSSSADRPHPAVADMASVQSSAAVITLDELVARDGIDVALMKIDVEGSELQVLEGARQILAEQRPVILVELSAQTGRQVRRRRAETIRLLHACEYTLEYPLEPDWAVADGAYEEVLCIPNERRDHGQR